jgi:hypothetical protein
LSIQTGILVKNKDEKREGQVEYTKTEKKRVSDMTRVEIEEA